MSAELMLEERIALHRRMAESYHAAYDKKSVKDGAKMGFYAYGFVETNDRGEITRWETHVNEDYSAFLDVAIGVHGPFCDDANPYMEALSRTLKEAGVGLPTEK